MGNRRSNTPGNQLPRRGVEEKPGSGPRDSRDQLVRVQILLAFLVPLLLLGLWLGSKGFFQAP